MYPAYSEAKNATKYATSSGLPNLRDGICWRIVSRTLGSIFLIVSVSIMPGAIQFAVMPRRPYSVAIDFVADANAPLDAAYPDMPASPIYPAIDVIEMMRPYLFFNICGTAARIRLYGTVKLTCIIVFMYVESDFNNIHPLTMPALLTKMSSRPLQASTVR